MTIAKRLAGGIAHRVADVVCALDGYQGIERLGIGKHSRGKQFDRIGKRQKYVLAAQEEMFVVNSRDTAIGKCLYQYGSFDFDKFTEALEVIGRMGLHPPDVCVDIGANIGSICIPAVSRGLVRSAIAIEPEPENCRLLRANIELNDLRSKIEVHEMAAGSKDGETLTLQLHADNLGDHRITTNGGSGGVAVKSGKIDTVIGDRDNLLIFMDAQGYEGHILAGATRVLSKLPPLVMEFWPTGLERTASFQMLLAAVAGYDSFVDLKHPDNVRPIGDLQGLYAEIGISKAEPPLLADFTDVLIFSRP